MQLLMITAALSLCHITLSHIGIAVVPNLTQQWLISNPSLVCSLCSVNEYLILGRALGSQSSFNDNQSSISLASAKFDLKQGWQHPEKRSSETVWQTNINFCQNWIYKYEYIGFYKIIRKFVAKLLKFRILFFRTYWHFLGLITELLCS